MQPQLYYGSKVASVLGVTSHLTETQADFGIFLPRNVQRKVVTFLHRRTSYRRALFERLYFLLLCRVVSFPLGWNSERKPDGKIADCNLESGIRNRAFYSKHNLERDRPLGWGWTNWKIDRVMMKF